MARANLRTDGHSRGHCPGNGWPHSSRLPTSGHSQTTTIATGSATGFLITIGGRAPGHGFHTLLARASGTQSVGNGLYVVIDDALQYAVPNTSIETYLRLLHQCYNPFSPFL